MLCASELTNGYNGIRDYIIPHYYDYFSVEVASADTE